MTADVQITLSLLLTFGVPLGFAVHELRALRFGGDGRRSNPVEPAPLPLGDTGLRPELPDCLRPNLPQARPIREKVLEDA